MISEVKVGSKLESRANGVVTVRVTVEESLIAILWSLLTVTVNATS